MKFGVATFFTGQGIGPAALAQALEERGFDSLFVTEHTHIPASRRTPYPAGGELPERYYRLFDPFLALTAAATVTRTLLLGTGVGVSATSGMVRDVCARTQRIPDAARPAARTCPAAQQTCSTHFGGQLLQHFGECVHHLGTRPWVLAVQRANRDRQTDRVDDAGPGPAERLARLVVCPHAAVPTA
jgi:Luciferase-like monooxygenase